MKRCAKFFVAVLVCCSSSFSFAAAKPLPHERIVAVEPDGSIRLETSGPAVFDNVFFPDNKLAETWLNANTLKQVIAVEAGDTDRYGKLQIISNLEEKMLQAGIAVIYAREGGIPAGWRTAEANARNAKRGLWASDHFLLNPDNAAQHLGEFHVIEGTLKRIYQTKAATYLNFGQDWHSDFSIAIPPKVRRSLQDRLENLKAGTTIRVRGVLVEENGPMIDLNSSDNLEMD